MPSQSLAHEYVSPYHDPTDEPVAGEKFDWSFNDADLPVDTWKVMMYGEILGALFRLNYYSRRLIMIPADFHQLGDGAGIATGIPEGRPGWSRKWSIIQRVSSHRLNQWDLMSEAYWFRLFLHPLSFVDFNTVVLCNMWGIHS